MSSGRKFRSKGIVKPSAAVLDWQKQMLRLVARYSSKVREDGNGILQFSWNIAYVDLLDPGEVQYEEFVCQSNNVVFATMIFESQMISVESKYVTVYSIEFNNLVN